VIRVAFILFLGPISSIGFNMKKKLEVLPGIKALIFDIDGTLADTMPAHFKAFRKVLGQYGIDFTQELFITLAGVPVEPQMHLIQKQFNPHGFEPKKVAREKEEEYFKTLDETKPIAPVFDLLKKYHSVLPIGCGTGGDRQMARRTLEVIGAIDKVEVIVSCDDVLHGKPAPDTFLRCAELLGVEPSSCQVFEDGVPGIEAALAAGMKVTDIRQYI